MGRVVIRKAFSYKSGRLCTAPAKTVMMLLYSGIKQKSSDVNCNVSGEEFMSSILTSASSGDERRLVERKPLRVRVRVTLAGRPEMEVRSVDVSTGGMSLVVDVNLAPATPCNLSFTLLLPDGSMHKVQIAATVAHCTYSGQRSGFVIGLQFKGASEELKGLLQRYMKG
jgi:hypothetical protein